MNSSRAYRIMTWLVLLATLMVCLLFMTLFAPVARADSSQFITATPAGTLIICQPTGKITLAPNVVGVNVRSAASYTAPISADAIKPSAAGYSVEAVSPDGNFYKLCGSGWVARVTQSGQVLLNFVAAAPTASPVVPTRLPSATVGPSPTPRRNVWVEFSDGTLWQCDLPCHFTIYDQLPER